jgi:CRP/FNR family cyclic AMP-dependent transcriptional regulator
LTDAFTQFPSVSNSLPESLISAVRSRATVVRTNAGRTLVSPDHWSTNVYVVAEGRAQVALLSSVGHEVILRDLGAGDMFGELSAIDQRPRSASIFALNDCVLVSIPGAVFCQSVFETPASAEWLARRLSARIRDLTDKVFELNALRVPDRLHCELLRLCGTIANGMETPVIEPSPTHAELASRIGTHREAITREMGYLVEQKIVHQHRRRLTILDLPALAKLVRTAAGQTANEAPASIE